MSLVTKSLGSSRASSLCKIWSSFWVLTSILRCIWRQGTLALANVNARWMAIAYESIKLDGCRPCTTCKRNGYPKSGMSLVSKSLGSFRASCVCRLCLSSRSLSNLLRCIQGRVTLPLAECWCKMDGHSIWEYEAPWLSIETTNLWERTSLL